jgi:hypothetical protein
MATVINTSPSSTAYIDLDFERGMCPSHKDPLARTLVQSCDGRGGLAGQPTEPAALPCGGHAYSGHSFQGGAAQCPTAQNPACLQQGQPHVAPIHMPQCADDYEVANLDSPVDLLANYLEALECAEEEIMRLPKLQCQVGDRMECDTDRGWEGGRVSEVHYHETGIAGHSLSVGSLRSPVAMRFSSVKAPSPTQAEIKYYNPAWDFYRISPRENNCSNTSTACWQTS